MGRNGFVKREKKNIYERKYDKGKNKQRDLQWEIIVVVGCQTVVDARKKKKRKIEKKERKVR